MICFFKSKLKRKCKQKLGINMRIILILDK